ncbi:defensin alpha 5-like [Erinaceus europaeus]|uniref:Defensin alpha 5-like n=1 Tax=Erinaceus europaeus TaxID=9365 RepID=A0ABM3VUA1_ERIEU|nr:defensin alpha 5-like [Erinaceus europaeus]
MRTLALLSVFLLLALQGKAQPLGETPDQLPTTDDQGTESEGQAPMTDDKDNSLDQAGAEDTGMSISLESDERLARNASGPQSRGTCYCRRNRCKRFERVSGWCRLNGIPYNLCC